MCCDTVHGYVHKVERDYSNYNYMNPHFVVTKNYHNNLQTTYSGKCVPVVSVGDCESKKPIMPSPGTSVIATNSATSSGGMSFSPGTFQMYVIFIQ